MAIVLYIVAVWGNFVGSDPYPGEDTEGNDVWGVTASGLPAMQHLAGNGRSVWGISATGEPYYDSAGVEAADEARLALVGWNVPVVIPTQGG